MNKWEQLWNKSFDDKDLKKIEKLLDDDFVFFDENGSLNKIEFLEECKLFNSLIQVNNCKEIKIKQGNEFIYSSGLVEVSQRIFNQQIKEFYRLTKFWEIKGNEFKVVVLQATKIKVY